MNAARVIADHPAERIVIVRGRIGAERQPVFFRGVTQPIEYYSRLNPGAFFLRIHFQNAIEILREIEDYGCVAALSGEACTATSRKNRGVIVAAQSDSANDVVDCSRNYNADRNLPVIRTVRRIERAAPGIKAYFSFDLFV